MVLPLQVWVVLQMSTDGFPDHGILTHENLPHATEGLTDLLHLLGTNIVNTH